MAQRNDAHAMSPCATKTSRRQLVIIERQMDRKEVWWESAWNSLSLSVL